MPSGNLSLDFGILSRPQIPLAELVDPSEHSWTSMGPLPLSEALDDKLPLFRGMDPWTTKLAHLAFLADLHGFETGTAVGVLLEHPHWQYFCGFEFFQREFTREQIKEFTGLRRQLSESRYWKPPVLKLILECFPEPERRVQASRLRGLPRLLDLASPKHPWVIASELLISTEIEELKPGVVDETVYRAALLCSALGQNEASFAQSSLKSSVYWQYFCGYERYREREPEDVAWFRKKFGQLKENRAQWNKARELCTDAMKRASQLVIRSEFPRLQLMLDRGLQPLVHEMAGSKLPVEIELKGLEGSEQWEFVAEHLRNRGWCVTLIAEDDLRLAQKNLRGPLLHFIPGRDSAARALAISGQGTFADIVLDKPDSGSTGRALIFSPGPEHPQERLEAAIAEVATLDEFLESPEVQRRYFEALSLVYPQNRFPKAAFDALLLQLKEVARDLPEVGKRLWQRSPSDFPSFTLEPSIATYGRDFNSAEFEKFLRQLCDNLPAPLNESRNIKDVVAEVDKEVFVFEARSVLGAAERSRKSFYASIKRDPRLAHIQGQVLRAHLMGDEVRSRFETADADRVIHYFKQLKENPATIINDLGYFPKSSLWYQLLSTPLPSVSDLLNLKDAFPPHIRETRRGRAIEQERFLPVRYRIEPFIRKLHAIWRGIPVKDCVGGHPAQLEQLMPERWASIALEGAIAYLVTRGRTIEGGIQLIPIELEGRRYYSIDAQWHRFFSRFSDEEKVFEEWLRVMTNQLSASHLARAEGFVVGEHPAGRDPFEQAILRTLSCYQMGEAFGTPLGVSFADPLAAEIVALSERRGYGPKYRSVYGNRILTDAGFLGKTSHVPLILLNAGATKVAPENPVKKKRPGSRTNRR